MNPTRLELAIRNNDLKMINIIFKEQNITFDNQIEFEIINSICVFEHITSKFKLSENTLQHVLVHAFSQDNIEFFIYLILKAKVNPSFSNQILLMESAKEGKIGFLKVLLSSPEIKSNFNSNDALNGAIIRNQEITALHLARQKEVYTDESVHRCIRFAFVNKMFGGGF